MVGAAFLVVGVLGFVPGITANYDEMSFAGHSGALFLGIFAVLATVHVVRSTMLVSTTWERRSIAAGSGVALPAERMSSATWPDSSAARREK